MATQEEIEFERDRIRALVHTLGNVLETVGSSSENVGTALANLKIAQDAVTTAKAALTQRAAEVVEHVTNAMTGLPGAVSAKLLRELNGSIQTSVATAVTTLTTAAEEAGRSAAALDKAVKLNFWTMIGIAVAASVLAGCVTSAIICFAVLKSHAGG
jgi:ElaB/YqjD/DUF883 family membrane-anchored ribosome-binding protein